MRGTSSAAASIPPRRCRWFANRLWHVPLMSTRGCAQGSKYSRRGRPCRFLVSWLVVSRGSAVDTLANQTARSSIRRQSSVAAKARRFLPLSPAKSQVAALVAIRDTPRASIGPASNVAASTTRQRCRWFAVWTWSAPRTTIGGGSALQPVALRITTVLTRQPIDCSRDGASTQIVSRSCMCTAGHRILDAAATLQQARSAAHARVATGMTTRSTNCSIRALVG